jgi:hypothetical protein
MTAVLARADNDDDNVLAALHLGKPSREQFRGTEASAAAHLVGIGKCGANPLSMFGQQIRMTLGYVRFALFAELNVTTEISARKWHHIGGQDI